MKDNPHKHHLLLPTSEEITMNVQDLNTTNSKSEKLLGFQYHVNNLCIKSSSKIYGIVPVAPYMNIKAKKTDNGRIL